MRLVDLDPQWILHDGKRIGFTFVSPTDTSFRQSCFLASPSNRKQWELFADHGDGLEVQGCTPGTHWIIDGGIDSATFETMTVTPSIDGSPGGLWHGFVTNGEIVGGM